MYAPASRHQIPRSWHSQQLGCLLPQVEEQRVSGGVDITYFHEPIGSVYQGLGNVMLRLEPAGQPSPANSTVLLNAHYDSTLGSQGGCATSSALVRVCLLPKSKQLSCLA